MTLFQGINNSSKAQTRTYPSMQNLISELHKNKLTLQKKYKKMFQIQASTIIKI